MKTVGFNTKKCLILDNLGCLHFGNPLYGFLVDLGTPAKNMGLSGNEVVQVVTTQNWRTYHRWNLNQVEFELRKIVPSMFGHVPSNFRLCGGAEKTMHFVQVQVFYSRLPPCKFVGNHVLMSTIF